MRKSIAALLLAVCTVSMTACGSGISGHLAGKVLEGLAEKDSGKDKKDSQKEDKKKDQETGKEEREEETGASQEEEDLLQTKAEEGPRFTLSLESNILNEWRGSETLMSVSYDTLSANQEAYPGLSAALESLNRECETSAVRWKQDNLPYAQEAFGSGYFYGYEYLQNMYLQRADEKVVSMIIQNYEYTGGAHGGTYFQSKTFDTATGRELTLADVTTDLQGLADAVVKELNKTYPVEYAAEGYRDVVESQILQQGPDAYAASWALGYRGIIFEYGSYELGSYAMGCPEVIVPFDDYPGLFKEEYTHVPEEYAASLRDYNTLYEDVDGDGELEGISVSAYDAQRGDLGQDIQIYVGGTTTVHVSEGQLSEAYLIRKRDGSYYLYVSAFGMNDMPILHVFRFTGESAVFVGDAWGHFGDDFMVSPSRFTLYDYLDVLSTYSAYRDYCVGSDGMPEPLEEAYTIRMFTYGTDEPEPYLTAKIPVPAWMVSADGKAADTPEQLPAGTRLYFRKTDNKTFVEMELEDGRRCQIRGDFTTWPKTINGMDEYECFDGIMYAG